jgi:exonuclease VII small subunit
VDVKKDESGSVARCNVHEYELELLSVLRRTSQLVESLNASVLLFQDALALMLRAQEEMNEMLQRLADLNEDEEPPEEVDLAGEPIRT